MSLYRPDPTTLYPALLIDGWHVMDKFGPLDGPYASVRDTNAVIENERQGVTVLGRHPSYAT